MMRPPAWLGWLAILTGLTLHKWALEPIVAPDEHLASGFFVALITLFQLCWIGLGVGLLWRRSALRLPIMATRAAGALMMALLLLGIYGNLRATNIVVPHREVRTAWQKVTTSEEMLLALTPELIRLRRGVEDLTLPDDRGRHLFSTRVNFRDLPSGPAEVRELTTVGVQIHEWQTSDPERAIAVADLDLWRSLLDRVDYFEHADFKLVKGRFVDNGSDLFETEIHFSGLARTQEGPWESIDIDLVVRWQRQEPAVGKPWRIVGWDTRRLTLHRARQRLFDELLDVAVADPETLERSRRSLHEERIRDFYRDPEGVLSSHPYFVPSSADFHPGLSVVDVDRDGFDDLYVMERWGPNLLLRNRGDGSFEDVAETLGLDIEDHTSSAIFADFDNDGDTDVVLGRTLARSRYLIQENGRFVDRSASHVEGPLPCLVSAVSAVDYDRDGLLDVYLSTYGAAMERYLDRDQDPGGVLEECLSDSDREAWRRQSEDQGHWAWNSFGPPNVMLKNRGQGRFEVVRLGPDIYRNTFQSTWTDYDLDGDPDVYLANDFAPNNLLRNEGGGRFSDATEETGTADIGFGMGASWGDYDNDGRHDLYVSNMFSKAGRRITAGMPGLDSRAPEMSRGNSLLRNTTDGFRRLSGLTPESLQVEKAGWSWGGQLTDLDNDGFLDVYATSGFFTTPLPYREPGDL